AFDEILPERRDALEGFPQARRLERGKLGQRLRNLERAPERRLYRGKRRDDRVDDFSCEGEGDLEDAPRHLAECNQELPGDPHGALEDSPELRSERLDLIAAQKRRQRLCSGPQRPSNPRIARNKDQLREGRAEAL